MYEPTPEIVRETFEGLFAKFTQEERNGFRQRFLVHDYETFPNKVLLVTLDLATGQHWVIWGTEQIRAYLRQVFVHNESTVLIGYNNKKFDNHITDAILDGADEAEVKRVSDQLIENSHIRPSWRSGEYGRRPTWVGRTFDIGFDIGQKKVGPEGREEKIPEVSLKRWERLNGIKVYRCSIPFDKPLIRARDIAEVERYCLYDVCATAMLVLSKEAWDPCLNARRVLVDDYGDRGVDWEMTKPRITAIVLNADERNYEVPADWEDEKFKLPSNIRIWKNRDVLKAYTENTFGQLRNMSSKKGGGDGVLSKNICGVPHVFGVGGVHGCVEGIWKAAGGGIWALDAASLYPNLMRHYGLLSRRVVGKDRERFGDLIDLRVKVYKPKGDKRAEGLKLVLNGGCGAMGFEKSDMYDPVNFCSVTILGQLLITDLLEKLERHIELIQSNTDGVFFRLRDKTAHGLETCRKIVTAFEKRTMLEMEWTEFERMYQRDVSNYVAKTVSGSVKSKGTWFSVKHCTETPYLIMARTHAALNDGEVLPPTGIPLERFAIEIKRDKNSEAFLVDGKRDEREWLDVVPVLSNSPHKQDISVLCKDDGSMTDSLFSGLGEASENCMFGRKQRKATNCPPYAALLENIELEDIDLQWYYKDKKGEQEKTGQSCQPNLTSFDITLEGASVLSD